MRRTPTPSATTRVLVLLSCALALPAALGAQSRTPPDAATPRIVDSCPPPSLPDASAVRLDTGMVYRVRGPDTLRLDLARPAAARRDAGSPLVLLVHGGGWRGGDRSRLRDQLLRLAGLGYAAASIDYRLTRDTTNRFPAAMQDVVCAVRWARARQRELEIDGTRIVVAGESSGAQLAALLGTVPDLPAFAGDCEHPGSASVLGVISMFGLLDLGSVASDPRLTPVVEHYLGNTLAARPDRVREASPVAQANGRAAPFLLVHGAEDASVPSAHSRTMRDALRRAGAAATYLEVPGQGHGFPMVSDAPALRRSTCSALAFLEDRFGSGMAQPERPSGAAPALRPYLVALSVGDARAMHRWYRDALGFRSLREPYVAAPGVVIGFLERDDFRIELVQGEGARRRASGMPDSTNSVSLHGFVKLGFAVADVDSTLAALRAKGVRPFFGPVSDSTFRVRHALLRDPEGNELQLFQPLP